MSVINTEHIAYGGKFSVGVVGHNDYSSVLKPFGLFSFGMRVLGIETSCDESAVCLIDAEGDFNTNFRFEVLGNSLISQASIHAQYGGVFPNLAKREHSRNLVPLLEQTLIQSGQFTVDSGQKRNRMADSVDCKLLTVNLKDLLSHEPELYEQLSVFLQNCARPKIDCIAVTVGPGLEPALWVGINFARALSAVWNIPVVAVNHMEGHLLVALLQAADERGTDADYRGRKFTISDVSFPTLALLISGGHTELVFSEQWQKYKIVGATRDDAVGEAYDKVARLLGLPYPGGPYISALAEMSRNIPKTSATVGVPSALSLRLPRPMMNSGDMDFSFAGLKTAVRRIVEANSPLTEKMRLEIAREFEDAVADVLVTKTIRAVEEYGAQTVIVGGGVSANSYIRFRLSEALNSPLLTINCPLLLFPPPELSTDNALMIALAGYFHAVRKEFADPSELRANGNLKLA